MATAVDGTGHGEPAGAAALPCLAAPGSRRYPTSWPRGGASWPGWPSRCAAWPLASVAAGRLLAGPRRGRRAFRHRRRARRRRAAGRGRRRAGGNSGGDGGGGAAGTGRARRRAAASRPGPPATRPADLRPVRRRYPARPRGRARGRDRRPPPPRRRTRTSCRCMRHRAPGAFAGSRPRAARPGDAEPPAAYAVTGEQVREWAFLGWCALIDADKYLRRGSLWEADGLHEARPPHLGTVGGGARRPLPVARPVAGARPRPGEPAARHRVHRGRTRRGRPAPCRPRQRRSTRNGQRGRRPTAPGRPADGDGRLRDARACPRALNIKLTKN